jgi:dTDP-4-amino-4,6-dideoxygalactose transaminase
MLRGWYGLPVARGWVPRSRHVSVTLTLGAVVVGWVLFRAASFAEAMSALAGMAGLHRWGAEAMATIDPARLAVLLGALGIVFTAPNRWQLRFPRSRSPPWRRPCCTCSACSASPPEPLALLPVLTQEGGPPLPRRRTTYISRPSHPRATPAHPDARTMSTELPATPPANPSTATPGRVPFLDVGATYRELRTEIDEALHRTLKSGWYLLGAETRRFEEAYAAYSEAASAVGVANGLDALCLALRALGVGPGDEVIVPSNTFIATWLAASSVGAVPVPVEPSPATFTIDPELVRAAITPRTRAIIPVHLYGHPADMDPIMAIARTHGLRVLDDAAQAHGARYRGRRIGALGDATAWSFYPGKNLGAMGDAGAVTTDDAALAAHVRSLGNYGSRVKYEHEQLGVNSRLDEVQSAVLAVKLGKLDEWNERRRTVARRYAVELDGLGLGLPTAAEWAEPVWHLYVVRVPDGRDGMRARLLAQGVETVVHYPRSPHLQTAYASMGYGTGDFPRAEAMDREVLSLPIGPHMRPDQVDRVVETVRSLCLAGAAR